MNPTPTKQKGRPELWRRMPDDFTTIAPTVTRSAARRHWRTGWKTIDRWYEEAGIAPGSVQIQNDPPPADFKALAPTMTRRGLCRHYKAGGKRIDRWLKETGVDFKRLTQSEAAGIRWKDKPRKNKPKRPTFVPALLKGPTIPPPDTSPDGLAAEHLRKWCPVYRCDDNGRPNPKGGFWRFGNTILTPEEVKQRAIRKGWSPDEWRLIAA